MISASPARTAAVIALTASFSSLNRQIAQDRTATQIEKTRSAKVLWLSSTVAIGAVTGDKSK